MLEIRIKKFEDKIEYSIQDNGIGLKAAGQVAQNKQKSYGMQLSFDRVRLFNKERASSVKITDIYKNGKAQGTLISAT